MVASGLGITVLPATALTPRHANLLVRAVPFAEPQPARRIALAWRRGFYRASALQHLAETIRGLELPVRRLS
jgi:LysR family hydrogen peroxide-inducible transcriptional activator